MSQTINSEGQAPSAQASPVQEITVVNFLGEDIRVLGTPQEPLFIASDVARWIDQPKAESVCRMLDKDEAIKVSIISSYGTNGEPLFCLKDVATCLGYADQAQAVRDRCDADSVVEITTETSKGLREAKFGPESEVYRLIFGSKLESAKKFQDWVFKEVLPSIRKTGSYSVAQPSYQLPQNYVEALEALVASEKEKLLLLDQNNDQKHIIKQQSDVIDVLLPKAQAYEDQMSDEGWFTGSEAAKQLRVLYSIAAGLISMNSSERKESSTRAAVPYRQRSIWMQDGSRSSVRMSLM